MGEVPKEKDQVSPSPKRIVTICIICYHQLPGCVELETPLLGVTRNSSQCCHLLKHQLLLAGLLGRPSSSGRVAGTMLAGSPGLASAMLQARRAPVLSASSSKGIFEGTAGVLTAEAPFQAGAVCY